MSNELAPSCAYARYDILIIVAQALFQCQGFYMKSGAARRKCLAAPALLHFRQADQGNPSLPSPADQQAHGILRRPFGVVLCPFFPFVIMRDGGLIDRFLRLPAHLRRLGNGIVRAQHILPLLKDDLCDVPSPKAVHSLDPRGVILGNPFAFEHFQRCAVHVRKIGIDRLIMRLPSAAAADDVGIQQDVIGYVRFLPAVAPAAPYDIALRIPRIRGCKRRQLAEPPPGDILCPRLPFWFPCCFHRCSPLQKKGSFYAALVGYVTCRLRGGTPSVTAFRRASSLRREPQSVLSGTETLKLISPFEAFLLRKGLKSAAASGGNRQTERLETERSACTTIQFPGGPSEGW